MTIFHKIKEMNKPRFYVIGYYTKDKKAGERKNHQTPMLNEQEKRAFMFGANALDYGPYIALEGTKEQVEQLMALQD